MELALDVIGLMASRGELRNSFDFQIGPDRSGRSSYTGLLPYQFER
jgi:hypothetical protein